MFVELRNRLQELLGRYGMDETIERSCFYRSLDAAVADLTRRGEAQ